jgi:putative membrane protein insertion efficiency factor
MTRFDVFPAILWSMLGVLHDIFWLMVVIVVNIIMLKLIIQIMFSVIFGFKRYGFFQSNPGVFPSKRVQLRCDHGIIPFIQICKLCTHQPVKNNKTCAYSVILSRVFESKITRFLHLCVRSVFIASIAFIYRGGIRPSLIGSCRFHPTCSAYAIQALRQHGLISAVILMTWRILRCNPWGQCGHDPVPSSLF